MLRGDRKWKERTKIGQFRFFFCIQSIISKVVKWLCWATWKCHSEYWVENIYIYIIHIYICIYKLYIVNHAINKTPKKTLSCFQLSFWDMQHSKKIAQTCLRELNAYSTGLWSEIIWPTLPGPLATGTSQRVLRQDQNRCGRSLFIMNSTWSRWKFQQA